MNRSVLSVRVAAAVLVTYPRSTPTGYAVSANPIAATLEKLCVGQRSGVRPVLLSVCCQNQSKVRCSTVSRNAVCLAVSAEGGVGPLIPVIDVALVHADTTNKNGSEMRRSVSRTSGMGLPCCDCTKVKSKNRRWLQSSATSAGSSCGHATAYVRDVEMGQKFSSAPSWYLRASVTTQLAFPKLATSVGFPVLKHPRFARLRALKRSRVIPSATGVLPKLGKSFARRMSTFRYGKVPGTVNPPRSKLVQKRWHPTSMRYFPPSVTRPEYCIPQR